VPVNHSATATDCLSSIAKERKFYSWRTIYQAGENAALRDLRKDPNVLGQGDSVSIPDKNKRAEPADTGRTHVFEVTALGAKLRVIVEGGGAWYSLTIDTGKPIEAELPESGLIEQEIARDASTAELSVWFAKEDKADKELAVSWHLVLGALEPVDFLGGAGVTARLANLGFLAPEDRDKPVEVMRAVGEFQAAVGLPVNGVADPNTLEALRRAHDVE
jgi:hypothetical protein